MKSIIPIIIAALWASNSVSAQTKTISMSEVEARTENSIYKYFEKGSQDGYTGYLTASYPNGNLITKQNFVDGVGEGTWYNYYENGNVREEGTYENNLVQGPHKTYYENGNIESEGTYTDWRIRVGTWKYYNNQGQLVEEIDYGTEGDFRDVESYYKNGDISKSFYQKQLDKVKEFKQ